MNSGWDAQMGLGLEHLLHFPPVGRSAYKWEKRCSPVQGVGGGSWSTGDAAIRRKEQMPSKKQPTNHA